MAKKKWENLQDSFPILDFNIVVDDFKFQLNFIQCFLLDWSSGFWSHEDTLYFCTLEANKNLSAVIILN